MSDVACFVGVDLGGTKALTGTVDASLGVHHRARREIRGLSQSALLDAIVAEVEAAREAAPGDVEAVGFGIPCTIDQRTGIAVQAVNLPIHDLAFADLMAERIGLPVSVDNDGNLSALAEQQAGAARGATEVVMFTAGTGIGSGLVLRGEVYRGAFGAATELGHTVIAVDGPRCQGNCPNRGCLEAMASGTALAREAHRIGLERPYSGIGQALRSSREITGEMVTTLAHQGDAAAIEALELIGHRLGVGIANAVNTFNPEVVVVGGGVIAAGELLLRPAREEVARRALEPARSQARIVQAGFGEEAGMIGAAIQAITAGTVARRPA